MKKLLYFVIPYGSSAGTVLGYLRQLGIYTLGADDFLSLAPGGVRDNLNRLRVAREWDRYNKAYTLLKTTLIAKALEGDPDKVIAVILNGPDEVVALGGTHALGILPSLSDTIRSAVTNHRLSNSTIGEESTIADDQEAASVATLNYFHVFGLGSSEDEVTRAWKHVEGEPVKLKDWAIVRASVLNEISDLLSERTVDVKSVCMALNLLAIYPETEDHKDFEVTEGVPGEVDLADAVTIDIKPGSIFTNTGPVTSLSVLGGKKIES